jgi:hypothetical protein
MENQALDRRQMLTLTTKGAMALAAVGTIPLMEGCNAQQWIATALADLPTIIQIVTSILGIVAAARGTVDPGLLATVTTVGTQVQSDLQLANTLVAGYQTAAASAQPGILGKIDAALTTALNNLNSILVAFRVGNSTLEATIAAALGASITIVLAIQALIPPPPAAAVARVKLANPTNQSDAMKTAYNLIVGKNYPNAVI